MTIHENWLITRAFINLLALLLTVASIKNGTIRGEMSPRYPSGSPLTARHSRLTYRPSFRGPLRGYDSNGRYYVYWCTLVPRSRRAASQTEPGYCYRRHKPFRDINVAKFIMQTSFRIAHRAFFVIRRQTRVDIFVRFHLFLILNQKQHYFVCFGMNSRQIYFG